MSLASIAADWRRRELGGKKWTAGIVRRVLTHEMLAGLRDGRPTDRWEPILTRRDHDRLVAHAKARAGEVRENAPRSSRYTMTGLVYCAEHGYPMRGRPVRGRPRYLCLPTAHVGVDRMQLEWHVVSAIQARGLPPARSLPAPETVPEEIERRRAEVQARLVAAMGLTPSEWRIARAPLVEELEALDSQAPTGPRRSPRCSPRRT